ncbi:hypothetical protein, partial [uncultured Marinobacter sp.]|uniref:hypothetical protein n=1 Tax=uncultured Marinobacter sp. TaxID=187379 RepID=UPI002600EC6E
ALAWERARAIDDLHADSPDPFAGVPEAAAGMLEAWSARDPEAALAFLADDARDRVAPGHWSAVLESLAAFDPVRSLELATAADSEGGTLRLSVLGHIRRAGDVSPAWPLFADLPSPLTGEARHAELTRVVSLLGGDADEEARWIVWLESDDPFAAPPIALPDPCLAR